MVGSDLNSIFSTPILIGLSVAHIMGSHYGLASNTCVRMKPGSS